MTQFLLYFHLLLAQKQIEDVSFDSRVSFSYYKIVGSKADISLILIKKYVREFAYVILLYYN